MERQDILERRARTGRLRIGGVGQDKSTGAEERLSGCLHIQDLSPPARAMSLKHDQALRFAEEERLHRGPGYF